jgi:hypothetical protein
VTKLVCRSFSNIHESIIVYKIGFKCAAVCGSAAIGGSVAVVCNCAGWCAAVRGAVCGSASDNVRQCGSVGDSARGSARQCAVVLQCACSSAAVCGSASGSVWQCARQCATSQAALCGSVAVCDNIAPRIINQRARRRRGDAVPSKLST